MFTQDIILYLALSQPTQLLLFSVLLLVLGLSAQVYRSAVQLQQLDDKPLSWVEFSKPHMPSLRVIIVITVCGLTLLLGSVLLLLSGITSFGPTSWFLLASFFAGGSAVGILAELRWPSAREYAHAIIIGTALAFLFTSIIWLTKAQQSLFLAIDVLLFLGCSLLSWRGLFAQWNWQQKLLTIGTAGLWLLFFS